mmetsp:Transcript_19505/g.52545  ORF Transcript_19505/g.52545 Transcript_19505/m.52545 type:complete len:227 (+) Transcript_19505:1141-1821(+)
MAGIHGSVQSLKQLPRPLARKVRKAPSLDGAGGPLSGAPLQTLGNAFSLVVRWTAADTPRIPKMTLTSTTTLLRQPIRSACTSVWTRTSVFQGLEWTWTPRCVRPSPASSPLSACGPAMAAVRARAEHVETVAGWQCIQIQMVIAAQLIATTAPARSLAPRHHARHSSVPALPTRSIACQGASSSTTRHDDDRGHPRSSNNPGGARGGSCSEDESDDDQTAARTRG